MGYNVNILVIVYIVLFDNLFVQNNYNTIDKSIYTGELQNGLFCGTIYKTRIRRMEK